MRAQSLRPAVPRRTGRRRAPWSAQEQAALGRRVLGEPEHEVAHLAAGLAGLSYPLGHGNLVNAVLGVQLPKAETLTEWRRRPLTQAHFTEFVKCYGADPNGRSKRKTSSSKDDRWRKFHVTAIEERDFKLDGFKWIKEESANGDDDIPSPEELASDAIAELQEAVGELGAVLTLLENGGDHAPGPSPSGS